jgi:hypothetical protein
VLLPFQASAQLLEGRFLKHPCLLELARFVDVFVGTGSVDDFARLEAEIKAAFAQNSTDVSMHHAMIVLAWWTRLLYVDEDEARGRAAELLGSVVFASARSPLNFPASELFHSCRFVTCAAPLMPNVHALQTELNRCGPSSLSHTVVKVIFHATQMLSLLSSCEVLQSAELLIHELMSASTPMLLVCLHELHCRGMLEMVVNVLLRLRQQSADALFPIPFLLERVGRFKGVHWRLHCAMEQAAHYLAADLPQPHDELFAPSAAPQPTFAYVPKIEQQHDSDDHRLYSNPSSPFPSADPPPLLRVAASASCHTAPTSSFAPHFGHQPHFMSSPSPSSSPSLFGFSPAPVVQPQPYHPLYQHHPHIPIYHHQLAPPPPPPYSQHHQQPVLHHPAVHHYPAYAPRPAPPSLAVLPRPPSSSLPAPPQWAEPHLGPE